jgi:hypothetical protein
VPSVDARPLVTPVVLVKDNPGNVTLGAKLQGAW